MLVSVAIVAYNEEKTLPALLNDLLEQEYPRENMEVLLIDSLSSDGTKQVMETFARQEHGFARVVVLDNPGKILPCGCNVALKNYTGDAIVRIDAHASVPQDFISKNVRALEQGESVSGGARPNIIDEETAWKNMLLAAEQSMFGSGAADYRNSGKKKYVSSVFHGMYRREVYDAVGLYNEQLTRTEDNDMSWRIRHAGYEICYDPDIVSYQHTRSSLKGMLRQKYWNGYWIGRTMRINPHCFSLFHFVPAAFVGAIIVTSALSAVGIWHLAALMWALYAVVAVGMAVLAAVTGEKRSLLFLLLPVVFLLLHLCYGAGTFVGLARAFFGKK